MATVARPLEIQQLEAYLKREFDGGIIGTGNKALDKERNFLSKAVAASFLMVHAGVSKADAIAACVDGGGDNGIDSLYISPTNVIWLVQSKYIHEGSGEPSLGDAGLFRDGVNAIVDGQFDQCKTLSATQIAQLIRVMDESHQVVFALVYTGTAMDDSRRKMFGEVVDRVNAIAPRRARFVRFGLSDFHEALTQQFAEPDINGVQIELRDYGVMNGVARAYYGSMSVKDLAALYVQHGHALVRANIRRHRGSSEVNESMALTLKNDASKFFYFNNGITLICRSIRPGQLDRTRAAGKFHLDGVSIINGAQTAGTVAQEPPAHYEAHPAEVLVTCIELPADDQGFADDVTRFRNSQNAVSPQDFAALDDNQESWRKTLQSEGVTYIVKRSTSDGPADINSFTLQEAAEARALLGSAGLELLLEHPVRLWDRGHDVKGDKATADKPSAYKTVFPDSLTARKLWRTVQIARIVQQTIEQDAMAMTSPLESDFARQSARLMAHVILIRCKSLTDGETLALTTNEQLTVSSTLDTARNALVQAYSEIETTQRPFAEAFADLSTLCALKALVMQALHA
ncbi:conserved hypothetical protein [Leptothrix cholodnii SP-6]|uniref:Abortive phage infection protein C-terminal domain-containing protein n=1 Tax=Leptothrix cholodnii (strain ATCC 51168 / LMG 8142 / SP-6) TaxID=395495 RepID=B1XYI5_LEPCP|nr:conserved hypothetical protein [Leptothrix cholodnii SP-6]